MAPGTEEFQHQLHLPQLKGLGHLPLFQPRHGLAEGIGAGMKQVNDSSNPALTPLEKHMEWPLCAPQKVGKRVVSNSNRSFLPGRWRCTWAASLDSPGSHTRKGWRRKDPGYPVSEERQVSGTIYSRFLPPLKLIHAVASQEFGIINDTT